MGNQLPVQPSVRDREGNRTSHTELLPMVSESKLGQSPLAIHTARSQSSMCPQSKGVTQLNCHLWNVDSSSMSLLPQLPKRKCLLPVLGPAMKRPWESYVKDRVPPLIWAPSKAKWS